MNTNKKLSGFGGYADDDEDARIDLNESEQAKKESDAIEIEEISTGDSLAPLFDEDLLDDFANWLKEQK